MVSTYICLNISGYVVVLEVCSSIISNIPSRVGRASVSTSTIMVYSHFVNSHMFYVDKAGIDKVERFTTLDIFKHCYS